MVRTRRQENAEIAEAIAAVAQLELHLTDLPVVFEAKPATNGQVLDIEMEGVSATDSLDPVATEPEIQITVTHSSSMDLSITQKSAKEQLRLSTEGLSDATLDTSELDACEVKASGDTDAIQNEPEMVETAAEQLVQMLPVLHTVSKEVVVRRKLLKRKASQRDMTISKRATKILRSEESEDEYTDHTTVTTTLLFERRSLRPRTKTGKVQRSNLENDQSKAKQPPIGTSMSLGIDAYFLRIPKAAVVRTQNAARRIKKAHSKIQKQYKSPEVVVDDVGEELTPGDEGYFSESSDNSPAISASIVVCLKLTPQTLRAVKDDFDPAVLLSELPSSEDTNLSTKKTKRVRMQFTNTERFMFGYSHYAGYTGPSHRQVQNVFNILKKYHKQTHNLDFFDEGDKESARLQPIGPVHATSAAVVTVDALIQTMLSQSTDNDSATLAHFLLRQKYKYTVNGSRVAGIIPNYHEIRVANTDALEEILRPAGFHKMRAKYIQGCLDFVYEINEWTNSGFLLLPKRNALDVADFVPGRLSLDYLRVLNKQEMFDSLVTIPGIGTKTACCILAFNYKLPVFAVDTHVFRMVKWLRWVPEDCYLDTHRDKACSLLDSVIPDELKYALHQAFWHHGRECLRCRAETTEKTKGYEEAFCPLEHLINRSSKVLGRAKPREPAITIVDTDITVENSKKKPQRKSAASISRKSDATIPPDEESAIPKSNKRGSSKFKSNNIPPQSSLQTPNPPSTDLQGTGSASKTESKTPKLKSKAYPKLSKPTTIPEHKMKPEAAAEKGYILIEQPPINDNFGAERMNVAAKIRRVWMLRELIEDVEEIVPQSNKINHTTPINKQEETATKDSDTEMSEL